MIREGQRVRLRDGARLAQDHPELVGAIGVASSIVRGSEWSRLGSTREEREADLTVHVRFKQLNLVALSVSVSDIEAVDHLDPA